MYKFTLTPQKIEDFVESCERQHDEDNFLKVNAISSIQTDIGTTMTWGMHVCKKKYVDPYTEEIISEVEARNETEFKEMIKDEMGIVIDFPISLKAKNFTGFTEAKFKQGTG